MLKLFILTLTLFSTVPTVAMRILATRFQQRGYATMTSEDFTKLLRYENGYPLSPKVFISELAAMKKDDKDLDKLCRDLARDVSCFHHALSCELSCEDNAKFCREEGHNSCFEFFRPDGAINRLTMGAFTLALLGIPVTGLTIGASGVGGLVILILKALETPEALEIACKGVNVIEHAMRWCAGPTTASGAFFLLSMSIEAIKPKPLKCFSYTNKKLKIRTAQKEHVASLIKQDNDQASCFKQINKE